MKHCYLLLQGRVRINEFGDREPTIQVYQYKCRQHGIQALRYLLGICILHEENLAATVGCSRGCNSHYVRHMFTVIYNMGNISSGTKCVVCQ